MMSTDGRIVGRTMWQAPDGRELAVVEDSPGVVHVTTDALAELLRLAGFTEVQEPIRGVAVQGDAQVLRDEHGRCQECGTPPAQDHRADCPHSAWGPQLRREAPAPGASYELRPGPPVGEERR